jgi:hypothetical protein
MTCQNGKYRPSLSISESEGEIFVDSRQANEALKSIDAAEARLAGALKCPPWRHAAFGVVMATFIFALTVPSPIFAPAFLFAIVGVVWLLAYDRRTSGIFTHGLKSGPTLPIVVVLIIVMIALALIAIPARQIPFPSLRSMLCTGTAFIIATAASVLAKRIVVASLRKGIGQ